MCRDTSVANASSEWRSAYSRSSSISSIASIYPKMSAGGERQQPITKKLHRRAAVEWVTKVEDYLVVLASSFLASSFLWPESEAHFSLSSLLILARSSLSILPSLLASYFANSSFFSFFCSSVSLVSFFSSAALTASVKAQAEANSAATSFFILFWLYLFSTGSLLELPANRRGGEVRGYEAPGPMSFAQHIEHKHVASNVSGKRDQSAVLANYGAERHHQSLHLRIHRRMVGRFQNDFERDRFHLGWRRQDTVVVVVD